MGNLQNGQDIPPLDVTQKTPEALFHFSGSIQYVNSDISRGAGGTLCAVIPVTRHAPSTLVDFLALLNDRSLSS